MGQAPDFSHTRFPTICHVAQDEKRSEDFIKKKRCEEMDMDVSEFREHQAANTLFSKYAESISSVQTEGFMNKAPSANPAIRPPISPSQGVGLLRGKNSDKYYASVRLAMAVDWC